MSLPIFVRNIKALARRIEVNVDKHVIETATLLSNIIILETPVDTGRARNNWFLTPSSPTRETTTDTDKTGAGRITSNRFAAEASPLGAPIYLSNNLPYIGFLNEGSSAQAPAMFVEKAIARVNALQRNKKVVK